MLVTVPNSGSPLYGWYITLCPMIKSSGTFSSSIFKWWLDNLVIGFCQIVMETSLLRADNKNSKQYETQYVIGLAIVKADTTA